jgi:hypothetical protein
MSMARSMRSPSIGSPWSIAPPILLRSRSKFRSWPEPGLTSLLRLPRSRPDGSRSALTGCAGWAGCTSLNSTFGQGAVGCASSWLTAGPGFVGKPPVVAPGCSPQCVIHSQLSTFVTARRCFAASRAYLCILSNVCGSMVFPLSFAANVFRSVSFPVLASNTPLT